MRWPVRQMDVAIIEKVGGTPAARRMPVPKICISKGKKEYERR